MLEKTKFKIDEVVRFKLNPDLEGIIMYIVFHSKDYWVYAVQWNDGITNQHKESELLNEEESLMS